jgi:hypothetical protein
MLGDHALRLKIKDELRAYSFTALDIDRATHLLDDFFADGKTEPCALFISLRVLIQFAKVNE